MSPSPPKRNRDPKRCPISRTKLRQMVAEATVDCYNQMEQLSGWFTVIEEHLAVPFETTILGVSVTVEHVELNASEEIVAVCRRGRHKQAVPILNLPLPTPLPDGAEWIAAYRHWLGEG